jgi:hypothetical protein
MKEEDKGEKAREKNYTGKQWTERTYGVLLEHSNTL